MYVLGKLIHCMQRQKTQTLLALIVCRLWNTHAEVSRISLNTNKWLILIRIIVESGLLYMFSEVAMLVSDLFGNAAVCVADAVAQTIVSTTLLHQRHRS